METSDVAMLVGLILQTNISEPSGDLASSNSSSSGSRDEVIADKEGLVPVSSWHRPPLTRSVSWSSGLLSVKLGHWT